MGTKSSSHFGHLEARPTGFDFIYFIYIHFVPSRQEDLVVPSRFMVIQCGGFICTAISSDPVKGEAVVIGLAPVF